MYVQSQELAISQYQKQFWIEWAKDPASSAYNISAVYKFSGGLEKSAFKRACELFVRRHQVVHLQFTADGEETSDGGFLIDDFYSETVLDSKADAKEQIFALLNLPFALSGEPLLRIYLLTHNQCSYFVLNMQHTIADAIFIEVASQEISADYNAIVTHRDIPHFASTPFSAAIKAEREFLSGADMAEAQKFWSNYLADLSLRVNLPCHKLKDDRAGESEFFALSAKHTKALLGFAKQHKVSLFVVLASLYGLLLSKYARQQELLLSYAVNMRGCGAARTVGCFVNNVPLKITLNDHTKLTELIAAVAQQRVLARPYQWYLFSQIIHELRKRGGEVEADIFNVGLVEANLNVAPVNFYGVRTENVEIPWHNESIYQFCLQYDPRSSRGLKFKLEYQKAQIEKHIVSSFIAEFLRLLKSVPVKGLELSSYVPFAKSDYLKLLRDWGRCKSYKVKRSLPQLFEEQVASTPEAVALVAGASSISYQELNRRANQLARYLRREYRRETGIELSANEVIALYLRRGVTQVIAILAVLKAGGAYLPIAEECPRERVEYLLTASRSRLLLTDSKLADAAYSAEEEGNLPCYAAPSDLAYVIYTSGTTGSPKGVMQPHRNVVRLFKATAADFKFSAQDVWTLYHSYAFDFSVWELWGALLHGGKLIIPSSQEVKDIPNFYKLCCAHKVTVLNQTPTAFYQFAQVAQSETESKLALRYIIFGGEALHAHHLREWWQYSKAHNLSTTLCNMYGITETTVHVTLKKLTESELTIGKPLADLAIYLLDSELKPVPIGVPGEIYVAGAGLANGYLYDPQLTAERFIPGPFAKRLYKTGDLARYLPNGELEYIGRNDSQVKIRGYRVELGEIEVRLRPYAELGQFCVIEKNFGSTNELICFYSGQISTEQLAALKNNLKLSLPEYMLPSRWQHITKIPTTVQGKIAREALQQIPLPRSKPAITVAANSVEKKILKLWRDVLANNGVGINDNFFDVGGNSIKALSLYSRIQQIFEVQCGSVIDLFEYPTVKKYASYLARKSRTGVEGCRQ